MSANASADAMSCAEAEPLLPLVADGAVDPDSDPQLFAHLAACPACQRAVSEHDLVTIALQRGASARRRAPIRPARILTLPRLALAAGIALAVGAGLWLLPARPAHPAAPLAQAPARPAPSAVAPAPPAVAAAPAAPEVLRIPRADGSSTYLVRRGSDWVAVDPAQLDGPDQAAPANADGLQVRNGPPDRY